MSTDQEPDLRGMTLQVMDTIRVMDSVSAKPMELGATGEIASDLYD